MNKNDEPKKQAVPFGLHGQREELLLTTPSGDNSASYDLGFPPITMILKAAGGLPPKGQDMNQILYELASIARWSGAGGSYGFDSTFSNTVAGYPAGARILASDGSGFWLNTLDANTTQPENDTATLTGWIPDGNFGLTIVNIVTSDPVVLTTLQAAKETLILTGNLIANITITVPAWVKKWTVFNHCTGDFSVTMKIINGKGVVVSPLANTIVWGDGSKLLTQASAKNSARGGLLAVKVLSGTGNYTPSPGTKNIRVKAQGAGGSGGNAGVTGPSETAVGAGGTAGAYGETTLIEASRLSAVTFSVGKGGASGGAGSASMFGDYITAPGGRAGYIGRASSNDYVAASSDPPSDTCTGTALLFSCPGQGGSGPIMVGRANNKIIGGQGGASFFGGGGTGLNAADLYIFYKNNLKPGNAEQLLTSRGGIAFGSGGAGAAIIAGSKNLISDKIGANGGSGAQGILIIEEYT